MRQNGTNTEAPLSDATVRITIAYLDSHTDYREFISPSECRPRTRVRCDGTAPLQEESLWLLMVPIVVIVIAVVALITR